MWSRNDEVRKRLNVPSGAGGSESCLGGGCVVVPLLGGGWEEACVDAVGGRTSGSSLMRFEGLEGGLSRSESEAFRLREMPCVGGAELSTRGTSPLDSDVL